MDRHLCNAESRGRVRHKLLSWGQSPPDSFRRGLTKRSILASIDTGGEVHPDSTSASGVLYGHDFVNEKGFSAIVAGCELGIGAGSVRADRTTDEPEWKSSPGSWTDRTSCRHSANNGSGTSYDSSHATAIDDRRPEEHSTGQSAAAQQSAAGKY